MKKVITLSLIIAGFAASAQNNFEIGKVNSAGTKLATLSGVVAGSDTSYILHYADLKFQILDEWKTVTFSGKDAANTTYNTLMDAFTNGDTGFSLGDNNIAVKSKNMLGSKYLQIFCTNNAGVVGMAQFTKKQLKNLFNK